MNTFLLQNVDLPIGQGQDLGRYATFTRATAEGRDYLIHNPGACVFIRDIITGAQWYLLDPAKSFKRFAL